MLGFKFFFYSIFAVTILLFSIANISYSIPVIKGEDGFGIDTKAGRGGEIYKITNLESSGKGSLRECINAKGPRVCIFEVSGTITLTDNLEIHNPYITIAGQSAPSPGITIAGAGISIKSNDVLIQHIRVRVGDNTKGPDPESRDAILIGSDSRDVYNIVIDHVSASWAIDEVISTWSTHYSVYDVSILNSIFSEGLFNSDHPEGRHSMGVLIGKNSRNILIKNNIFIHNNARNPLIRDDATDIIIANNLIYGSGGGSKNQIYFGTRGTKDIPLRSSVVGNLYLTDDFNSNMIYIEDESASSTQIYLKDNIGPKYEEGQWMMVLGRDIDEVIEYSPPVWIDGLNVIPAYELKDVLIKTVGARPLDRDAVDKRLIGDILENSGMIIDSQKDVGSWPELEENRRKFSIPKKPDKDSDKNGYTNLEELLFLYSYSLESENINISNEPQDDFHHYILGVAEYLSLKPHVPAFGYFNFSHATDSENEVVDSSDNDDMKFYIYFAAIVTVNFLLLSVY